MQVNDGPDQLSILTVCKGAVPEVFDHLVQELLKNVADPNTSEDQKRRISLEFVFEPLPDRSGAIVTLETKSKLSNIQAVQGSVFFAKKLGEIKAYTTDPRQTQLFGKEPTATDKAQ